MMKTNLKRGLITISLATTVVLFTTMAGFCNNNAVLSSINIEGINDSYNIELKMSKDADVVTKVPSQDKLILELNNTESATLIKTGFKQAGNIEDVIVQPLGKNKTRLFISGKNVSNSKIVIDSTKTAVIADKFAEENIYPYTPRPKSYASAEQKMLATSIPEETPIAELEETGKIINISDNKDTSIAETTEITETTETPTEILAETPVETHAETTGVTSPAPVEETSVEDSYIATESTDEEMNSELFRPAADLESIDSIDRSTTIDNNQASAAAATVQSLNNATKNDSSPFSNSGLMRFAIVFVFVTILIAYLRKENIISFNRRKPKKQSYNREHLDIYKALQKNSNNTQPRNRVATRSKISNLDRTATTTKKQYSKTNNARQVQNTENKLNQLSALKGYSRQNTKTNNAARTNRVAPQSQKAALQQSRMLPTGRKPIGKQPANNIEFLKSMANLYEQSGRHDLAMNIQKNIRKSLAKT